MNRKALRHKCHALWCVVLVCLSACNTVQVREYRRAATGIEAGEVMTVMLDYGGGPLKKARALEDKLSDYIIRAVRRENANIRFVNADAFRRVAFPGMDIDAAPRSPETLLTLLSDNEFQKRIAPLDIRYLVLVRMVSRSTPANAGMDFYTILVAWGEGTYLNAHVIDLKKSCLSGEIQSNASGYNVYGVALAFIPVIVPGLSEPSACKGLAQAVARFIAGNETSTTIAEPVTSK